jgi:hypothetical protein
MQRYPTITPLCESERRELRNANDSLTKLRRDEEAKWAQRAKVKYIQEGGDNTKYFHLVANGKHRRKKIFQLEQDEGTIVGQDSLKVYITEYYKNLFGPPQIIFLCGNQARLISRNFLLKRTIFLPLILLKKRYMTQLCKWKK